GGDLCSAELLQFRHAARVVEVHVRGDDPANVLNPKSQGTDVRRDLRGRLRQRGIDQHMAARRSDEDRAEAARADVVGVAVDQEGLVGLIPEGAVLGEENRGKYEDYADTGD